jgi:hypothetical protein
MGVDRLKSNTQILFSQSVTYIKLELHETNTKLIRSVPILTKTMKLLEKYMRESADFGSAFLFCIV